jgi:oligopeptidase A
MTSTAFSQDVLPTFTAIKPTDIEPAIQSILDANRKKLTALLAEQPYTFANLMQPLENMSDELSRYWSAVSHLHSVKETDDLRAAYNAALPHITAYQTELSQNEKLFNAISDIANSKEFAALDPAPKKIIENDVRDFKLAGVNLPADKKTRMAELQLLLCQAATKFSENVLDATQGFTVHITDKNMLAGLPEHALQLAIDNAKQRKLEGYVLTLDYPSYSTAMKFLHQRELRKTLYNAYSTRASNDGPNAGKWDNSEVMNNLLQYRHEMAELAGFKNFAEYSLATKMAKQPEEVLAFLRDLAHRSKSIAEKEYADLQTLAKQDGINTLEAWDISYYSEKLRVSLFNFSQEDLRPYFPISKVMQGLFALVNKLYGITVKAEAGIDVWNPEVQFLTLHDENGELRAGFYIDLYARTHKRDGAWMDECRARRRMNGKVQLPVAYLTCNFMPPVDNKEALLTHDDVLTLFHEFGHCLHHMLTRVDYASVSGINGVPWDAVEFPSQFMESFCWEKAVLDLITSHYQTGAALPDDLYQKMIDAKHFQTGLQMLRQLEFALFDFRIHLEYQSNQPDFIQQTLNDVRKHVSVIPVPDSNRFQHSFSHIFAGGYAAGYYSYKWAEVLSADAYAKFEEDGIFDHATGLSFMKNILETGGVRDPMTSFIAFRGRKPTIDALLKQSGIS